MAQQPQDVNKLEEIKEYSGGAAGAKMQDSGDFDDTPFKKKSNKLQGVVEMDE